MTSLAEAVQSAVRAAELEVAGLEERELELTAFERWARDPEGWIDAHVWTGSKFADGKRRRIRPTRMVLYPDQRTTLRAWIDTDLLRDTGELVFRNVVIEKSRQIGETWAFAAALLWILLFHPARGLAVSLKASEIADSKWTTESLFGRVRYAYEKLNEKTPGWARLEFKPSSSDPARIINRANGATVVGDCQRDDPGRGGTFDFVLVDEATRILHGEAVFASLDEACEEGIVLNSTVRGSDNFHARIADEKPSGWTYLRLHWSTHPIYSQGLHIAAVAGRHSAQPTAEMRAAALACERCAGTIAGVRWTPAARNAHRFPGKMASPSYDRAVAAKTAEDVASELDIDRERSLKARVFDEFETELHVARDPDGTWLEIGYDPLLPLELGFDYGLDVSCVVICQDHPLEYRVIGEVEIVNQPGEPPIPDNIVRRLLEELRDLGVDPIFLTPNWTRRIYARGDPSGDGGTLITGQSVTSAYRALGFEIGRPPSYLSRTVEPSIRAVKRLLLGMPKPVKWSARCPEGIRHMQHNRWPIDATGNRRISGTRPYDDVHNHYCRAFAYLIVSKFPPTPPRGGEKVGDTWDAPEGEEVGMRRTYGSLLDEMETLGYESKG